MLPLPASRVSVGEDPACEVPISAGLGIAPVHFTLEPWEGGHFIQDAGSGSRTLVNGEVTNWRPLVHGDLITAGELTLAYGVTEGEPISFDLPLRNTTTRVESVVEPVAEGVDPFPRFTFPGPAAPPAGAVPDIFSVPVEEVVSPQISLGAQDFAVAPAAAPAAHPDPTAPAAPPGWLPAELATPPPERVVPVAFHAPVPVPEATRGLPQTSRRRRLALVASLMALAAGAAAAAVIWKRQHGHPPPHSAVDQPAQTEAAGNVPANVSPEPTPAAADLKPPDQTPPEPEAPPLILEIRRAL